MARASTRTDRSGGSLSWLRRLAIDVSIVNPTAVSHSGAGACGESFLNPNAGDIYIKSIFGLKASRPVAAVTVT
jgi:hypothetical protein